MCHWNVLCLWLGWGLWSRLLIGAACVHWLLCWAVVLVGGGLKLCNCFSVVGRSFSLSSLGFWLRWWLALQTYFMWSCTMWTAVAWTWGGGSLWSRMADTSCVGIVSLWAPLCFNSPSFYLPHFSALWAGDFLSFLILSLQTLLLLPMFKTHSQRRSVTWSRPAWSESHSSGL